MHHCCLVLTLAGHPVSVGVRHKLNRSVMPRVLARHLIVGLQLLAACDATAPSLPQAAERFTPLPVYQQWWDLTEQCSGLSGSLAAVTWYRVPGTSEIPLGDGTMVAGFWDGASNRIVLASESELQGDLVRHEMLHALVRVGEHPRSMFVGRCGGIVVCVKTCLAEGGPPPPPDPTARIVTPSTLVIGVEVIPSAPGSAVNGGEFMMVVTAQNTSSTPVIVQLPPSGDAGPSLSFSYAIAGGGSEHTYNVRADAPEVTEFVPLETKRFIFDLHVGTGGSRYDQMPGEFVFRGAYGEVWATNPPTITVSP